MYLLNGNNKDALAYLRKGRYLAIKGGFGDNILRVTINLGSAHFISGEFELAQQDYFKALPIAEENYVPRLIWRIEYNLGNVFRAMDHVEEAMVHYMKAIEFLEKLRDNYKDDKKKANFMEHRIRPYQTMIMLALDKNKAFGDSTTAEQYLERGMQLESLKSFYHGAKAGLNPTYEREKDKNFFVVHDRGYFIETE